MAAIATGGDEGRRPLAETLRAAIRASGRSLTGLARQAGVDDGNLSRFMRGERDLRLASVDQLAAVLGLGLYPSPSRSPGATAKGARDGRVE